MVTLVGWNDGGGYDCDERRRRRFSVARVREPEKREESTGESESGPGGCVASSGRRGDRQRGRRWPGRVPARSGHAPASYCPRRKTTGMAVVVGWAATVEGQVSGLPGERQVVLLSLSISVFISVFLLFCKFRALLKILRHFQKS